VAVGPKAAGTEEDSVTMKRTAEPVGVACQQYVCQKKHHVSTKEQFVGNAIVNTTHWSTTTIGQQSNINTYRWVKESVHRLLHTLGVLHTHTADAHNGVAHTGDNEVSC